MRKVVANTTPLIALADIGQLELLRHLYGEILIPQAVLEEIESEPAKSMVSNASWIRKVAIEAVDRKTFVYTATESYESELKLYELEQDLVARDFLR